jgi:hypothetical protein
MLAGGLMAIEELPGAEDFEAEEVGICNILLCTIMGAVSIRRRCQHYRVEIPPIWADCFIHLTLPRGFPLLNQDSGIRKKSNTHSTTRCTPYPIQKVIPTPVKEIRAPTAQNSYGNYELHSSLVYKLTRSRVAAETTLSIKRYSKG